MFVSSAADESLIDMLREHGYEVSTESEAARAYERLAESPADLLVIDVSDAAREIELIKKIRALSRLANMLVLAIAEWGSGMPTLALSNGADAFEPKPIEGARLLAAVAQLLRPNQAMIAKASASNSEDN